MFDDFVVKFVIILLIASSVYSWALIFDKFKLFKKINITTEEFEKKLGGEIYEFFHTVDKVSDKRGVTIMIKRKILKNGRADIEEQKDEEGRFVAVSIKNLLDRALEIGGIYADNNAKKEEGVDEEGRREIKEE